MHLIDFEKDLIKRKNNEESSLKDFTITEIKKFISTIFTESKERNILIEKYLEI
jgi:hypothetical protein